MTEQFNEIKAKATALKQGIEALVTTFHKETGYTPQVDIKKKMIKTNDRVIVKWDVNIQVVVE